MRSIDGSLRRIELLSIELERADAILIGAGSGLSSAAGLTYSGERFDAYFADFRDRYGIHDMYSGGFYPYRSLEEYWAWWSRHIFVNRYMDTPKPVYRRLLELVEEKDYFVLTTNVDHCFQKAGFDKRRLFYTQGDYGLWQCSKACHDKTYDNEAAVRKMFESQEGMRIPSSLIPYCPVCGKPMAMNLRVDDTFVEDAGWHEAATRYARFLNERNNARVLFLELGVGGNTPSIIKFPFWSMARRWPDSVYACVNQGEAYAPDDIAAKSICIDGDIGSVLAELSSSREARHTSLNHS